MMCFIYLSSKSFQLNLKCIGIETLFFLKSDYWFTWFHGSSFLWCVFHKWQANGKPWKAIDIRPCFLLHWRRVLSIGELQLGWKYVVTNNSENMNSGRKIKMSLYDDGSQFDSHQSLVNSWPIDLWGGDSQKM
jgi:hypothetical protein